MKKSLSVLLAALLLGATLAGCSTNTENAADEQKNPQTNSTPTADLGEETEE